MRKAIGWALIIALFVFIAQSIFMAGCSQSSGPSDDEVRTAVNNSFVAAHRLYRKDVGDLITIRPPIAIIERGDRLQDGSFPVKVAYDCIALVTDGFTTSGLVAPEHREYITNLRKEADATGKKSWKASYPFKN